MEQGGEGAFLQPKIGKVVQEEYQRGQEHQQGRGGQDHLALHPVAPKPEPMLRHVVPGQKTDAADDDQQRHRQDDPGPGAEGGQGGVGTGIGAHHVEARVAEGGYGMEQGHPYPGSAVEGQKRRQHQQGARQFRHQGHPADEPGQLHDAAHLKRRDALLEHASLQQRDLSPGDGGDEGRDCDDAQTADLDQDQNDRLSEEGPVDRRILDHQTGHAHGGGGGEQSVVYGGPCARPGRNGQHQQARAQQDDGHKTQDDDLEGANLLPEDAPAHDGPPFPLDGPILPHPPQRRR